MLPTNGRRVALELSGPSVELSFTNSNLNRIINNARTPIVDQEKVRAAVAHTTKCHRYKLGDPFRVTTFGSKKESYVHTRLGPTKVVCLYFGPILNFQKLCLRQLQVLVYKIQEDAPEYEDCKCPIKVDGPPFCTIHPYIPPKTYTVHCVYDHENVCFVTENGKCLYTSRDQLHTPFVP